MMPIRTTSLICLALMAATASSAIGDANEVLDAAASSAAVEALQEYLKTDGETREPISEQPFAAVPLTHEDADAAQQRLWKDHVAWIRSSRADEMKERKLRDGELEMRFHYEVYGDKPERGRSLYLSLHGGGGAPARVNDQQWENQKRLYKPEEGVYVAPRAPTNTWNLWHQPHIDRLFDRMIENMIVFEDVDPERVYVMGYSAGGDGVYQLAPRMADRWAGAAMMAGHPNDASPLSLRNTAFTLHVGGRDAAYNRNKVGEQWRDRLAELRKEDAEGYEHWAKIYPDKSHWLDREDAAAIPWMAKFRRRTLPNHIVWQQDDVTHSRFYWLAVEESQRRGRSRVTANLDEQKLDIDADGVEAINVRLNDEMLDLDKLVSIHVGGHKVQQASMSRTIGVIAKTLGERGDPAAVFSAEVLVDVADAQRQTMIKRLKQLGATVYQQRGRVVEIRANRVKVTDDDLRHIGRLENMTDLSLEETAITKQTTARLSGLKKLEWLNLYRTQIGDEGLQHLRGIKSLKLLPIGETGVTDTGLAHLAGCTQLEYLGLRGNAITDEGAAHLAKLTNLNGLYLGETKVTNAALQHLLPLAKLQTLWLNDTAVSDDGVATLAKLKSLRELHLKGSQISDDGVARLRELLPACKIADRAE